MLLHRLAAPPVSCLGEYESLRGRRTKGAAIKEVPLLLLMAPQTAVSTGRSYPSTLGKSGAVENECILVRGDRVAKTRHL